MDEAHNCDDAFLKEISVSGKRPRSSMRTSLDWAAWNTSSSILTKNKVCIRKTISAGPVTLRDMHELLPFNNNVVVFSCYGRDILTLDGINIAHAIEKPHDICERTFLEEKIDPEALYRAVSHDFVLGQWNKHLGFKPFDAYDTGEPLVDSMIRQFRLQFSPPDEEGWD